ncbi:hypothetical protein THASP1DRAFT_29333 [Thamnocephalis sphaerospora]|uniref:Uncharacterized protein n=1 Tax=Thamnocephalis sphaerospora TaxID=78915 RepID=A0A4P9XTW5_9FUNG|nr:hypothetical protein THASP1DRAFT_29333 [Thamnocephalis sphaerospora]|eukprot:RKP08870.1 hypothetical protein THASP1DRAFT_29333 [Thamnocephalis sphaerospora]
MAASAGKEARLALQQAVETFEQCGALRREGMPVSAAAETFDAAVRSLEVQFAVLNEVQQARLALQTTPMSHEEGERLAELRETRNQLQQDACGKAEQLRTMIDHLQQMRSLAAALLTLAPAPLDHANEAGREKITRPVIPAAAAPETDAASQAQTTAAPQQADDAPIVIADNSPGTTAVQSVDDIMDLTTFADDADTVLAVDQATAMDMTND